MLDTEVTPYEYSSLTKKQQVEQMFDNISSRYDMLNRFFSFGIDLRWRKKVVCLLRKFYPNELLDVAAGTGDMSIMVAKYFPASRVIGLDISEGMLDVARKKVLFKRLEQRISLMQGDTEKIPFDMDRFDAVTVAFGVRNFERLEVALREIHRVLKPEGVALILEFSHPKRAFVKHLYRLYSYYMKFVGRMFSKDPVAYDYLPRSVAAFSCGDMEKILKTCGFSECYTIPLTFGVVSIYVAQKSKSL
ncbi:MAG: bifunctional demethylmenaquinone methyltransferase/2-methoxy-6-polyprenyl-1,4-benzoquinol methylase UbiE [Flavobacteriales bacterium Tduv]